MNQVDNTKITVDIVYLWVDNSDPKWQEKRAKYPPNIESLSKESFIYQ